VCGLLTPGYAQEYKQIVIATGSPFELGLIDELAKAFQKSHGGTVRCIKTPTGPGLELGRFGLTHITMGHEREATARFAADGFAARRTDLMHNFTVVVGPESDPAKVSGLNDLKEVHKRIFQAKSPYLSGGKRRPEDHCRIRRKRIRRADLLPDGNPKSSMKGGSRLQPHPMVRALSGVSEKLSTAGLHPVALSYKVLSPFRNGPKIEPNG
jgi:tungstate transport system substrate-binding protein